MNANPPPANLRRTALLLLVVAAIVALYLGLMKRRLPAVAPNNDQPSVASSTNQNHSAATTLVAQPATINAAPTQSSRRLPVPEFVGFQLHPFAATQTNGGFAWTPEDGRDTNVIRQLAHNELEYQRMVAENNTIFRRQLVYHPDGFTLLAQQAVQSGQSIQQVTVPGLDGQALAVNVTKTDLESGGDRGLIYGKLPDDPNSMVTVAFINDREAFTVVSPQDKIYLQGEAREPGEIVVKSIDPATYGGTGD